MLFSVIKKIIIKNKEELLTFPGIEINAGPQIFLKNGKRISLLLNLFGL